MSPRHREDPKPAFGPHTTAFIEGELHRLAKSGLLFSSDDLRKKLGRTGGFIDARPASFGRFFTIAQQRKWIVRVGEVMSMRHEARGRRISQWIGTGR